MDSVYLETSVFGYLTSRPHRDPIVAGHQLSTRAWWENERHRYRLLVSPAVIGEISDGDPAAAAERLEAAAGIDVLVGSEEVRQLAALYYAALHLPPRAKVDAFHLAYAAAHNVDYLATWNMTHIANADIVHKLRQLNRTLGRETPLIVTVESLTRPGRKL